MSHCASSVGRSTAPIKYQAPRPVSAERYVADRLALSLGTAHQRLFGVRAVNREAAVCYRALAQAGDVARAERWVLPILQARREQAVAYSTALDLAVHRLDLEEDAATAAYLADDCVTRDEAEERVRVLGQEIGRKLQLMAALVAKHGLERNGLELL